MTVFREKGPAGLKTGRETLFLGCCFPPWRQLLL